MSSRVASSFHSIILCTLRHTPLCPYCLSLKYQVVPSCLLLICVWSPTTKAEKAVVEETNPRSCTACELRIQSVFHGHGYF